MDYGCSFFWDSRWGKDVAQERGAPQNAARGLDYTFINVNPYWAYDHGLGRYVQYPAGDDPFPKDGMFANQNDSSLGVLICDPNAGLRSVFTVEAGLTLDTVPRPNNHIEVQQAGEALNMARVRNSTGSTKYMYQNTVLLLVSNMTYGCLVKRYDGGVVDENTVEVHITTGWDLPNGVDASDAGVTRYVKVRDDGWYLVYNQRDNGGSITATWSLKWKDGIHCYYEAPFVIAQSGGGGAPEPFIDDGVGDGRGYTRLAWHDLLEYDLPQCGWMGLCYVPRYDGAGAKAKTLETGYIMRLLDKDNPTHDYHQIYISNSTQQLVYQARENNVTSAFLNLQTADFMTGVPIGIVATWGYRNGGTQFAMSANGSFKEIDTSGNMPVSNSTGSTLNIGGSPTTVYNHAGGNVFKAALGNKMLTRTETMHLSRWFQKQAEDLNYIGPTGT
jgi:hypothetical protein